MIPFEWLAQAKTRITPFIKVTPLTYDIDLDMYLKWENYQVTGSFKARGAFNKVLVLEKWELANGLLAASAGNHGQGVALAGKLVGAPVTIYAPDNAPQVKIQAMRAYGAEVVLIPGGYKMAEQAALEIVTSGKATWISPYNDGHVIAGQGTLALEVIEQMENHSKNWRKATWLVPTSGGGLLTGIATAVKGMSPRTRVIGVQTETSPFMHALYYQGTQAGIEEYPTIADGLAGPVEARSITIPMVRELVDEIILVSESEIAQAVAFSWYHYGEKIEPSAAVVFAAILSKQVSQRPLIAILSGGNIQTDLFEKLIKDSPEHGFFPR